CDGDAHWTVESVREWWRERGRITSYLSAGERCWEEADWAGQGLAAAVVDYAAYIEDGLAADLRALLHWLEEGISPTLGDRLPRL
ncbi:hypothetical protein ACFZAU_24640, partial [Streptomyces sp. NPDC008238]